MAESAPLMGSTTNVERPRNWKEAKDSGWQPPVYDSEEVKRQVQKGFLTKVYGILYHPAPPAPALHLPWFHLPAVSR
jgi:hypothetical protein